MRCIEVKEFEILWVVTYHLDYSNNQTNKQKIAILTDNQVVG